MEAFLEEFRHLKIQLEQIKSATRNFDNNNVIGKGGFGMVYKGTISHSKGQSVVAFKRLDRRHGQGDPEFFKEILMLSRYTHENLISLLGFCDEDGEKILMYEYASRGSLDRHLRTTTLTWRQRLKICLGAAKGLCYLHDPKDTQQRVLHRDIKSSNILLEENWNAKVSDMGLSKIGPANQQHTFLVSNVVGTFGYLDPMYAEMSILTKESDVYSFGVVLFEVLCGRLCFEYYNGHFRCLVRMWKQSYKQKKLDEIILQDLKQHMDPSSLKTFSDIAYQCLQKSREKRPKMSHVVEKLEIALRFQEINEGVDYEEISKIAVPPLVVYRSKQKLKMPLSTRSKMVTGRHNGTDLHLAAQRGDLAAVKQIFDDIKSKMAGTSIGSDFDAEVADIRASLVNEVNNLGETALYKACENGHLEVVKELLKYSNKETIVKTSRLGFDPFHVAASQGHHLVVQLLLDHDVSLCRTLTQRNATPLVTAALKGHTAVVHELLFKDPSLLHIAKSDGKNALHLAAGSGHVEILKTLLEKDQRLARRMDKKGQTALHMAAKGVSSEAVKLLLEFDAATVMLPDRFGFTALHVATRKKRVQIVNELLSLPDTNVNALTRDNKTALDIAEGLPQSKESADIRASLVRHGALRAIVYEKELKMPITTRGKMENLPNMVLTDSGKRIDPDGKKKYVKRVTGRHDDTKLHLAAQRGDLAAVKQILDDLNLKTVGTSIGDDFDTEGAEIRASVMNEGNKFGETALYTACEKGHLEVVKELLKYSNKEIVAKKNRSGFDPLHVAASQGHLTVVQLLLDHDVSLCRTLSQANVTPLVTAAARGHTAVVHELLLKDPSLLDIAKSNGKNALHLATRAGHVEILKSLLEKDPQLARRTDKKGQTALHMAAKGVSSAIVKLLLEADADLVTLPDKSGYTALHVATRKKRAEIVNELLCLPDTNVNALTGDRKTALDIAEGLPLSEESEDIRASLVGHGAVRANELNRPRDEFREILTRLKERLSQYESVEDLGI